MASHLPLPFGEAKKIEKDLEYYERKRQKLWEGASFSCALFSIRFQFSNSSILWACLIEPPPPLKTPGSTPVLRCTSFGSACVNKINLS